MRKVKLQKLKMPMKQKMVVLWKERVQNFARHVCTIIDEMLITNGIKETSSAFLGVDAKPHTRDYSGYDYPEEGIFAEQVDALVDVCYYIMNLFTKKKNNPYERPGPNALICDEWYKMVYEFTSGTDSFHKNEYMSASDVEFIAKMVLSEVWELCDTVTGSMEETREMMESAALEAKSDLRIEYLNTLRDAATASDVAHSDPQHVTDRTITSLCSIVTACIHIAQTVMFVDIDGVFRVVHAANMNKRDPVTLLFTKREDGKVVKPPGWEPPNIEAEIKRQIALQSL